MGLLSLLFGTKKKPDPIVEWEAKLNKLNADWAKLMNDTQKLGITITEFNVNANGLTISYSKEVKTVSSKYVAKAKLKQENNKKDTEEKK